MDAPTVRLLIFDVIVIAFGGGMIFLGRWLSLRSKRFAKVAISWPTTEGTIAKAQYVTQSGGENSGQQTYYYVSYRYAVGGNQYSRSVKIYEETLFAEMQQKYPANASAEVHYDPAKPKRSTLDLRLLDEGKSWAILSYVAAAISLLLLAISLYVMIRG
jgi:Protein of unknown function (DUF3592)